MPLTRNLPVLAGLVAAAVTTASCSGGGEPPERTAAAGSSTAGSSSASSPADADPARFAAAIDDPRTFVINVHVPDAGSIPGTDATVPYDQIRARMAELPQDRSTPLAVYCRSGRMSAEALPVLSDLGYTDVVELRGGMDAWVADGRELLPRGG